MDVQIVHRLFASHFRPARMKLFASAFRINNETRIVDLGGTPFNWTLIKERPEVTFVNVPGESDFDPLQHKMVMYDGSVVPFVDNSFDVCYSNSVIEHVGDDNSIAHFASEIRRLAPRYFVQTPNRYFFAEPHFLCVFIHWLPFGLQRHLMRWGSLRGWMMRPDQKTIDEWLRDIRLLSIRDMRRLFPDAEIVRERFLGFTKSIIAMKR
jgi:methyltransferase family protein